MYRRAMIIGLQVYAVALALLQGTMGVRTDEAKYLLNIPYPHPPLVRFILSLALGVPFHELAWRVVFATVLVQSVWCMHRAAAHLAPPERLAVFAAWLLSAGVMTQAGSIMMAPLTACMGIFLLGLTLRHSDRPQHDEAVVSVTAVLWLVALFTAYQAVLLLPLMLGAVHRLRVPAWKKALAVLLPLMLLALYTLTNPLALASMLLIQTQGQGGGLIQHAQALFMLWLGSGSVVFSLVGTLGVLVSRRVDWMAAFILVSLYVFLSPQGYYAILFVPFFVAGTLRVASRLPSIVRRVPASARVSAVLIGLGTLVLWNGAMILRSSTMPNPARDTLATLLAAHPALASHAADERLLIVGPFGHEWQYYAPLPVYRATSSLQNTQSDVLVCLTDCSRSPLTHGMTALPITASAAQVYVKDGP